MIIDQAYIHESNRFSWKALDTSMIFSSKIVGFVTIHMIYTAIELWIAFKLPQNLDNRRVFLFRILDHISFGR